MRPTYISKTLDLDFNQKTAFKNPEKFGVPKDLT